MRVAAISGLVLWVGAALVLSSLRFVNRPPLAVRLRPYHAGGGGPGMRELTLGSIVEQLAPLLRSAGAQLARLFGVHEDVGARLARIHSPTDATAFRLSQLGWTGAGFAAGAVIAVASGAPATFGLALIGGGSLLGFLAAEQRLVGQSDAWQERLRLELPVVAEQLGMLLAAGYSVGGAIGRLAERGHGCCSRDLARVRARIAQGLSEPEALREWAALARVDVVDRLVAILELDREAGDLGRLIGNEARALRLDAHRRMVEQVERRGQQVWIPVTVATLVPGVLFLAIPFVDALRLFGGP